MHPLLGPAAIRPVILDGAWGTQLHAQGLRPGACPDQWNLTFPDRVRAVARSYVEAGSQVILTNTFGANRIVLSGHGLADQVKAINSAGARISREAAGERVQVFASMGPTGKLCGMGDVSEDELTDVFTEQARALAEGGAQALVLETFTDLEELAIALRAAKSARLPVVACMVFDSGAKKDRTAMGVTLEKATARLGELGADAIGANCGRGIDAYVSICARLRSLTSLPLWLKPNAGLPKMVDGKATYEISPEQFAASAKELFVSGASLIGGCCGSSPAFISALRDAFTDSNSK